MKNDSFSGCSASEKPGGLFGETRTEHDEPLCEHIIIHLYERDFLMTAQI